MKTMMRQTINNFFFFSLTKCFISAMFIYKMGNTTKRAKRRRQMGENLNGVPELKDAPDWSEVIKLCAYQIKSVREHGRSTKDIAHHTYEAAMKAVYGEDVWEWIRANDKG